VTVRRWLVVLCLVTAGCNDGAPIERAEDPSTTDQTSTSSTPTTGDTTTTTTTTTTTAAQPAGTDSCPPPAERHRPARDRPRYVADVVADPDSGAVSGTQRVTFTPDLPIDTVVFRLWANGPRPASVGTRISVTDASEGGAARTVDLPDPTTAMVRLGRTVPPGDTVRVDLRWEATVGGPVNDRIARHAGSLRLGSFLPLLAWQPGVGWALEPPTSGFAESTTSTTSDWSYAVTVPPGFGVIASGVQGADGRFSAEAARDVAIAVGRFTTVSATAMAPDPVAVTVSVHDGTDDPNRYLGQVVRHLETMSQLYGPYPWPTYALSLTPELSGGIEFPMHVMQGPATEGRTTPHEVAHMWFYGLVGNNQALHPWMDEGLATYVEGRLLGTLGSMAGSAMPPAGAGRAGEPMTYWESRASAYYRSVYVQPAAALAGLDAALVDCALARYVAENAHDIAVPDDLARAFDAVFRDWRSALAPAGLP
jgi:hypothetical protein